MPLWKRQGRRDSAPPAPFIVGVGRSGTTLLRLMLDAHPMMAIPPETQFMRKVMRRARRGQTSVGEMLEVMTANRRWDDFGIDESRLRERLAALEPLTPGDVMRAFYRTYADKVGKPRWGDKSTAYLTEMTRIEEALPEAHFLHIIRDARDVALSQMAAYFGAQTPEEAAEKWVRRVSQGRRRGAKLAHYMEVHYEALVGDPEPVLRGVCRFLALPWDPAVMTYHERADERLQELNHRFSRRQGRPAVSGERRLALHALTSRPPQPSRAGRWRTEMPVDQQRAVERIAGELLTELGYPVGELSPAEG